MEEDSLDDACEWQLGLELHHGQRHLGRLLLLLPDLHMAGQAGVRLGAEECHARKLVKVERYCSDWCD